MKKLIVILLMLVAMSVNAQWQPDVRLTNASGFSYTSRNNAWCVAANGNVVHTVWYDERDGVNPEIYYKRSTNAGLSWGADTRLTNNSAYSIFPSISVTGSYLHVVWNDNRDGNWEIYYKRSIDAGITWGADTRLTNYIDDSNAPSIAVYGSNVHVVWCDYRDYNNEIYYKRSIDGGITWGADTRLTNNPAGTGNASIAVSGSTVHVVWEDNRDGNEEIYYKRSTDGGIIWGADTRLTNNAATSWIPSIAVSGSNLHVVWRDNRDGGNMEIYYKLSTDNGVSWGADTRLTNNSFGSEFPSIAVSGSTVHVVWEDNRDGNDEIYYKRSIDGGVIWGVDTRLTNKPFDSGFPSIAVSGSNVHVVWEDSRDGNWEIYYKRDPTGNPVEINNISTEIPSKYSLSQNYPNPFNSMCNVQFSMCNAGNVKLVVYDVRGREVQTLVNEMLKPGTYEVSFDGSKLPSGVYFYKLDVNGFTQTRRMVMTK